MRKYNPNKTEPNEYQKSMLDKTLIIKVEIEELTGKKSGY